MQIKKNIYEVLFNLKPKELGSFFIWLFRIRRVLRRVNGIDILVNPAGQVGIETAKCQKLSDRLVTAIEALPTGGTFIDVGANEGLYSLIAARTVTASGQVYSIEPQERLWPVILQNVVLNQFLNIHLIPYAVGFKEGLGKLILMPQSNTGSSGMVSGISRMEWCRKKQPVKIVKLDRLIEEIRINFVDLLKIDVEGLELSVLESGVEALSKRVFRKIIIELHPTQLHHLGHSIYDVLNTLKQFQYTCYLIDRYLYAESMH